MESSNLEDFKNKAEPNFYKPVMSAFCFLENNYKFKVSGSPVSYETSIHYTLNDVIITVFHSFPDPPTLIFKKYKDGKIVKERSINKVFSDSAKKSLVTMRKMRNKLDIDLWCDRFRAGDFNEYISDIIQDYSQLVKRNIDKIVSGDFDSIT